MLTVRAVAALPTASEMTFTMNIDISRRCAFASDTMTKRSGRDVSTLCVPAARVALSDWQQDSCSIEMQEFLRPSLFLLHTLTLFTQARQSHAGEEVGEQRAL